MPTNSGTTSTDRTGLRTAWGRFLDTVLPAPDVDRLVRVAEVGRAALPLVEGGLADVSLTPVLQEISSMTGESRFVVLVSARDAATASEVLAGV